jgi:hypothetical protein
VISFRRLIQATNNESAIEWASSSHTSTTTTKYGREGSSETIPCARAQRTHTKRWHETTDAHRRERDSVCEYGVFILAEVNAQVLPSPLLRLFLLDWSCECRNYLPGWKRKWTMVKKG